mmetsp:Transcript_16390/g.36867  ORF Transcript_16390/g.36867 Transcript_16390/m.36867 type:complete len:287 (+) Transcript_16390:121-981(+)
MMWRCRCCTLALLAVLVRCREKIVDKLDDDSTDALDALRQRAKERKLRSSYAVVMASGEGDLSYSQLTVPIWEAYCEKHGMDFFLQQRRLNANSTIHFEWTRPRTLMELMPHVKWKYLWMVSPNSLPMGFNTSFKYAIALYMRHKRYGNDNPRNRVVWCPWDCEEQYDNYMNEGACYRPHTSGCIFQVKKKTQEVIRAWYHKRVDYGSSHMGLANALDKTRHHFYDEVAFTDVGKEMGRPKSNMLAYYEYLPGFGFKVRDMLDSALKNFSFLGDIVNVRPEFNAEL